MFARCRARPPAVNCGFTLIELLVVISIIAVLAAILLPALAAAKTRAQRMQCMSQIKQLDLGINVFTGDHDDTYPPAGFQCSGQLSWDTLIYSYIGGGSGVDQNSMTYGVYADDMSDNPANMPGGLKIMACPADTFPKVSWMMNADNTLAFAVRTYAMNSPGSSWGVDFQIPVAQGLPNLYQPGMNRHGVGIYYSDSGTANWSAPGYPVSVIRDPAGTILLCEDASSQGAEGNVWPCTCLGPQTTSGGAMGNLYQTDLAAPTDVKTLSSGGYSEGLLLYKTHHYRFNYAFHDGHVESLRIEDTVGTATGPPVFKLANPLGMWTAAPGD